MTGVVTKFRTRLATEFRKAVMTVVEASWEDPVGTLHTVPARMEDKSDGGACIRLKTPIAVGSKVGIHSRHEHFSGNTRYCRAEGAEYRVGIQRDTIESPMPSRPGLSDSRAHDVPPQNLPPQKNVKSSDPLASTVKIQKPPERQESKSPAVSGVEQKLKWKEESPPIGLIAGSTTTPARGIGLETEKQDSSNSAPRDFDALLGEELETKPKIKEPPKQAGEGRRHMLGKWFELPWSKEQEGVSVGDVGNSNASIDGDREHKREKENSLPNLTQSTQKPPVHSKPEVADFQVDLSPIEDIYRAAGIINPRRGYSINKVVEMVHSEHLRELSKEMKRAAVLMALDSAEVPIDQLQKDAKARRDALDSHEAEQKKRLEEQWARKAEEISRIEAELEGIKAHYTARISGNKEGVEREKATFADWVRLKQQECQSMAEAVELCLKSPVSEPASTAAAPEVSMVKVSAKTV
jgi:hypothetical protein